MKRKHGLWLATCTVCIVLIAIILAACLLVSMGHNDYKDFDLALSMDDIYIPEDMDKGNLGLFWLDASGKRYRYDSDNVPYNPEKPIVIYIHGWGGGGSIDRPDFWTEMGYNVGIFRWGQMAELNPFAGQSMLWGTDGELFGWERDNGTIETEDVPSHAVAQIFVACFNDFIKEHGFWGEEIRFTGHSLGAQATLAMSDYMLAEIEAKRIDPNLLPDRITLLDPYLNGLPDTTTVSWRGVDMSEAGSTKPAYQVAKALHDRGVAVEVVQSSSTPGFGEIFGGAPYYTLLKQYVTWVFAANDFNPFSLGDVDAMSRSHVYAIDWFADMLDQSLVKDYSYPDTAYGYSPFLPAAYSYARKGTYFDMPVNNTEYDMTDDLQYSDVDTSKIAGFAFWDKNADGVNNDGLSQSMGGIKVYLLDESGVVAQTETSACGYYEFLLDATSHGKNYYIKTELPKGCKIGAVPDSDTEAGNLMECNDIGKDLRSQSFEIADEGTLKIINIGVSRTLLNSLKYR